MKELIKRNHKNIIYRVLFLLFCVSALRFTGCSMAAESEPATDMENNTEEYIINGAEQIDSISVIDNTDIYSQDEPDSIAYFYVTVRYGSEGKNTNHTFNEVNNAIRFADGAHVNTEIYADALVQAGDENGPQPGMLGYGETESNARIRIRGNSSSLLPVKSYKLELDDNAGLWRGQSNIALNKHGFDVTRFRNKLYFDILKEIDVIPSVRTQFVILYIKDETSGETEFTNYGLFTQAEVPTKKYLKNHGMDYSGYLYKAISFNFEPNEAIKNFDDPEFSLEAMENVISCRGREDNQKLLDLIQVINDTSVDINYIIDTYFDRENYEYWLAYNILMGNLDTTMQNFYLYSPLNGNKWYFIPWDGDASLFHRQWELTGEDEHYAEWQSGISNYWGIILHQRFLKYGTNREELAAKVDELYSWLNKDYIRNMADAYNNTIEEYVTQMPDLLYLGYTVEERDYIVETLGDEIEDNYEKFQKSLTALMPFWMYEPDADNDKIYFSWEDAYDFNAAKVTYDLTVSRYQDMSEPVLFVKNIDGLSYEADKSSFEEGVYYWRVVAKTGDGRTTGAMNAVTEGEEYYCGIMEYYIDAE